VRPKHDSPNALCTSLANSCANEAAFEKQIEPGGSTVPRFGFNFESVLRLRRLQLSIFHRRRTLGTRSCFIMVEAHTHIRKTPQIMDARACVCLLECESRAN